jgi:23S rRNA pseudouridine1911/1915/1917 synthase
VLQRFGAATLLECSLRTGRTHQIRVHMKSLGHPLVGDTVYGGRRLVADGIAPFGRQALHAARLALLHPRGGQPVRFESPLPRDLKLLLDALE